MILKEFSVTVTPGHWQFALEVSNKGFWADSCPLSQALLQHGFSDAYVNDHGGVDLHIDSGWYSYVADEAGVELAKQFDEVLEKGADHKLTAPVTVALKLLKGEENVT